MKIFSDCSDVPELVSVEDDSRDGTDEEDEDDGEEDQLFDGAAQSQVLTLCVDTHFYTSKMLHSNY